MGRLWKGTKRGRRKGKGEPPGSNRGRGLCPWSLLPTTLVEARVSFSCVGECDVINVGGGRGEKRMGHNVEKEGGDPSFVTF